jgi:hypothetical protein
MESEDKTSRKSTKCKTEDIGYHVNPGVAMLGVPCDRASLHRDHIACTWFGSFCQVGRLKAPENLFRF